MKTIIIWTAAFVSLTALAFAGVPRTINYQGYLTFKGTPATGPINMTFSLYSSNPARKNPVWQETQAKIPLTNGVYTVQLGAVNPVKAPFDVPYYLGVQVEGDPEMALQPLSSVPYAMRAISADSVAANSVDSAAISGKINNSKLDLSTVVAKVGDTMTGTLNLPADGLTVGNSQLVASGGKVGIGGQPVTPAVFQVFNATTTGQAALFQVSNSGNQQAAVYGATTGGGPSIYGVNTGTGKAGHFQISNPVNKDSALVAQTNGGGYAGEFLGPIRVTGTITSSVPTGTEPLAVASTTQVNNLNANLLNGKLASEIISAASDEVRTPISACGVTISTSGSYYVTQNLSTTGTCITVSASNVTLDLMGFTLSGDGIGTSDDGISLMSTSNVEVRNGTVRNFNVGIHADFLSSSNRVVNVRTVENIATGINMNNNTGNLIMNCLVTNNGQSFFTAGGILAGFAAKVVNNMIDSNGGSGIHAQEYSYISGNTISKNKRDGIQVGSYSIVVNNSITNNGNWGIYFFGIGEIVTGNSINNNNSTNTDPCGGMHLYDNSTVKGNHMTGNSQNNIYVSGNKNVIEENFLFNSTNGIYFNGSQNFYANNRATNTSNYTNTANQTDGGGNVGF